MRNFIFILAALAGFATQGHSFPDMQQYPHQIIKTYDGAESTASLFKDSIQLYKTKTPQYSGYRGYCPLTKYYIFIDGYDEFSECRIYNKEVGEVEVSINTVETEDGLIFRHYSFAAGRLVILIKGDICKAAWQSWIEE